MQILLISKSFYPVKGPRSIRATELAKELARTGNKLTVLTPRKQDIHDEFENEFNVKIDDLGKHFFYINKSFGVLFIIKKIILKMLTVLGIAEKLNFPDFIFYFKTKNKLKYYRDYDLIISIVKPHSIHWGVATALTKSPQIAAKWVADCGDPFMGNPFRKPSSFFEKYERAFCSKADFIAVPIKEAINSYYLEYRDKVKVIPQGFDFETDKKFISSYSPNSIPTFAYAGAFYKGKRDPSKLLQYLTDIDRDFRFLIFTSNFQLIKHYAEKSNGRIILRNYLNRIDLLKELSQMDFLVSVSNISAVQAPSKLVDYYLADRPVLIVPNNAVNPIMLKDFMDGNYENKYDFHNMERYNIKNVALDFLKL